MQNELKQLVGKEEKILYEGKPDKKCFVFESIFNPLLPFALIWAIVDITVLGAAIFQKFEGGEDENIIAFIIPFLLFHMMPVWLYLAGILFTAKRYKNTNYIITNLAIYTSSGIFSKKFNNKPFAELSHVDLHRGVFDQMFNVGDIITTSSHTSANNNSATVYISSISNYTEIYNLVKKLQQDIYTDVMYPNDKRSAENHGYKTDYKG